MEKRAYVRIDFKKCGMDYDYTICEWGDVESYISDCESEFIDATEESVKEYGKPEIIITPIFLTEKEYGDFIEKLEENA